MYITFKFLVPISKVKVTIRGQFVSANIKKKKQKKNYQSQFDQISQECESEVEGMSCSRSESLSSVLGQIICVKLLKILKPPSFL